MLADDDLDVYTEIAGTAENFDNASDGGCAGAGVASDFDVDDGAVEFVDAGNAFGASGCGLFGIEERVVGD